MLVTMKKDHWSIFYLLKELISKLEQCEYNFLGARLSRGQLFLPYLEKRSIRIVNSIMNSLSNYISK